jgi:hypothetical protein
MGFGDERETGVSIIMMDEIDRRRHAGQEK